MNLQWPEWDDGATRGLGGTAEGIEWESQMSSTFTTES